MSHYANTIFISLFPTCFHLETSNCGFDERLRPSFISIRQGAVKRRCQGITKHKTIDIYQHIVHLYSLAHAASLVFECFFHACQGKWFGPPHSCILEHRDGIKCPTAPQGPNERILPRHPFIAFVLKQKNWLKGGKNSIFPSLAAQFFCLEKWIGIGIHFLFRSFCEVESKKSQ